MPFFDFKNSRTGEVREVFLSPAELAAGYSDGPDKWERVFTTTAIKTSDGLLIGTRPIQKT